MHYMDKLVRFLVFAVFVVSISIANISTSWAASNYFNNATTTWDNGTDLHNIAAYFINGQGGTPSDIAGTNQTSDDYTPIPCPPSPTPCPTWLVQNSGTFSTYFNDVLASDNGQNSPASNSVGGQDNASYQSGIYADLLKGAGTSSSNGLYLNNRAPLSLVAAGYDVFNPNNNGGAISLNDMAYPSAIGLPPFVLPVGGTQIFDPREFVSNAAGLYNAHPIPTQDMQGAKNLVARYTAYYRTIVAIQSYSAYIISRIQTDFQNLYGNGGGAPKPSLADQLVALATSSSWATTVESEAIGKVYRHILYFESQNFVVNMRILKNLEEMNLSQAMNNSLLIILNQRQENQMLRDAQGLGPGK